MTAFHRPRAPTGYKVCSRCGEMLEATFENFSRIPGTLKLRGKCNACLLIIGAAQPPPTGIAICQEPWTPRMVR